jgi:hypothetical protein
MRDGVYVRFDADTAVDMNMDRGRDARGELRNGKADTVTSLIQMLARALDLAGWMMRRNERWDELDEVNTLG